jgi:hypothetical protein
MVVGTVALIVAVVITLATRAPQPAAQVKPETA